MRRITIPTALVALACFLPVVPAAAQDVAYPAQIRAGVCPSPGAIVAPLGDVGADLKVDGAPAAGSLPIGTSPTVPITASVTTVDLPLATMVGSDHSIVVLAGGANTDTPLVCGSIGGRTMGATDLPIALSPVGGSEYGGVALLSDTGPGTTRVAVYIAQLGTAQPGASAAPSAGASAAVVPTSVVLNQPLQFAGYDIVIEEARLDPKLGTLEIDGTFGNAGTGTASLTSIQNGAKPSITWGTEIVPLGFRVLDNVPPGTTVPFTLFSSRLPDGLTLDGSVLAFGTPDQHQATLPLQAGVPGTYVATQDFRIPQAARSRRIKGAMRVNIDSAQVVPATCTGRPTGVAFDPTGTDEMSLVLSVTIQGLAPNGALLRSFVTVPDGTSAVGGPGTVGIGRGDTQRDITLCYRVPVPVDGRYEWRIESDGRKATSKFKVPALETP